MLAIAAFMAIFGRAMGSTVDLRLAGTGIPALAHIAAALALAISNNCSLSEENKQKTLSLILPRIYNDHFNMSGNYCCNELIEGKIEQRAVCSLYPVFKRVTSYHLTQFTDALGTVARTAVFPGG